MIMITLFLTINIFTKDKLYSDSERRYLQQIPKLSIKSLKNGIYSEQMEKYISDQFIFRNKWVGVKSLFEYSLGKKMTNGVYFADDNYLIESFSSYDTDKFYKNLRCISEFTKRNQKENININTILVPTASSVLSEKLPENSPECNQNKMLDYASQIIPGFIDVSKDLSLHSSEYIYYKNDHHWTSLGAFYAYNSYRKYNQESYRDINEYVKTILSKNFYGTTYSRSQFIFNNPDQITAFDASVDNPITVTYNFSDISDSIYELSYINTNDQYSVFLNGNQPFTQIETTNKSGKRLMIIKDSYANTFAQMCIPDYEEIYLIDLRYFKAPIDEYIDKYKVTDILLLYNIKGFADDNNIIFLL